MTVGDKIFKKMIMYYYDYSALELDLVLFGLGFFSKQIVDMNLALAIITPPLFFSIFDSHSE